MKFYYRKEGTVVMMSDGEVDTQLSFLEKNLTNAEKEKLEAGYIPSIKNKKLILEETEDIRNKKKKEKVRADIQNATKLDDLKDILNTLLE